MQPKLRAVWARDNQDGRIGERLEQSKEGLLKDPANLKDSLLCQVVPGEVMAADVAKLTSANTALGKSVTIKVAGNRVRTNHAQVVITDVAISNGVIHVIDAVLLPAK